MRRQQLLAAVGLAAIPGMVLAEVGRVMSVESADRVVVVGESGLAQRLQLLGVQVPAEPEAAYRARKALQDQVLARVVRFERQGERIRLWVGDREISRAETAAATLPPIQEQVPVPAESPVVAPVAKNPAPSRVASSQPTASPMVPSSVPAATTTLPTPVPTSAPAAPTSENVLSAASQTAASVIVDRQEGVYHLSGCPGYARVPARQRLEFATAALAEQEGYRLAGNCGASKQ